MKSNIKTLFFLMAMLANIQFAFCACKGNEDGNEHSIRGRFVNNTVLKDIADTIPGGIPAYCFEMNFISDDSVDISNGFEDYKLSYTKEGDNYLLINASAEGNMSFTFTNDSTLILSDESWTGNDISSEFKRVSDNKIRRWVFDFYLNEKMVAGEYTLYKKNKPASQKVVFWADGHVKGLEDFISYTICYSGDCIGETLPPSNTITFKSNNEKTTDYTFKIDKKNKTLSIFKIAPPLKDVEGERAIKEMVFDLRKN